MKSREVAIFHFKSASSQTQQTENTKIEVPCIFFQKSVARACIYEKKVVLLHDILRNMPFREHISRQIIIKNDI